LIPVVTVLFSLPKVGLALLQILVQRLVEVRREERAERLLDDGDLLVLRRARAQGEPGRQQIEQVRHRTECDPATRNLRCAPEQLASGDGCLILEAGVPRVGHLVERH
jgi:hypothetical protein